MNHSSVEHKGSEFPGDISLVFKCLYIAVAVCGITGNFVFCHLLCSMKLNSNFFTVLLLNLSIADIISCISILPYAIVDHSWLSYLPQEDANIVCTFTIGQTPFWVATVASLFTLGYISATRLIFIVYPLKSRKLEWIRRPITSVCFILITWVLASTILLPNFFSIQYDRNTWTCPRQWPDGFNGKIYGVATAFLLYVLPVSLLIFTFVSIKRSLRRRLSHRTQNQNSQKTVELLGTLVLAFFICWGPFSVYWILSTAAGSLTFGNDSEGEFQRMKVIRCVVLVALCNTIVNPVIYFSHCDEIKDAFWSCFGCRKNRVGEQGSYDEAGSSQSNSSRL